MTNTRINVNYSAEAVKWLNAEAAKRKTSVADLLRRILDEARGDYVIRKLDNDERQRT